MLWPRSRRRPSRPALNLVAALEPVAAKLGHLLADPRAGLSADQIAALHHAYGVAAVTLGEQSGKREWLDRAVVAFRKALEERPRDLVPPDWAGTQNNLGIALRILGERRKDAALVREAMAAQQAALDMFRQLDAPADAAMAEGNLARSRLVLAALEAEEARLRAP